MIIQDRGVFAGWRNFSQWAWQRDNSIMDAKTGDKVAALDGHTQEVETLKFSPDGETLVSTAQDGTIFLWDWDEAITGASNTDEYPN